MDMDIDSSPQTAHVSPRDRIVAKLAQIGVPQEYLCNLQSGLVSFLESNMSWTPVLVQSILPSDEEVAEFRKRAKPESEKATVRKLKRQLREALIWLQWLMFKDEPAVVLKYLAKLNVGQRGVCGAVWGNNDIAYRCRTCEQDATCAICVPCFEKGNHKDHDYSMIFIGGGCCDCGDITAWKREGFCSRHKGAERIEPLTEEIQNSVGPVLDELFLYWRNKLMLADSLCQESKESSNAIDSVRFASEFTSVVVEMLLEFCKQSESLLSFVSIRLFSCAGLIKILLKTERFLNDLVPKKLHEVLLKLLSEPLFKYEFSKAYLSYYPDVVNEVVKQSSDDAPKDFAAISTFSVQIFTVPTLTPRLVKEMNLLSMLFGCLGKIFVSIASEDGRIQINRLQGLFETTVRVGEDIRFVMSHVAVHKYILYSRPDILRIWMKLVSFVQGMNPQKRETSIHVEEEIENTHLPFVMCSSIARIHSLMVKGAFSDAPHEEANGGDFLRHSNWMSSQESSASCAAGTSYQSTAGSTGNPDSTGNVHIQIPANVSCLFSECLKAIELCLLGDKALSIVPSHGSTAMCTSNFSALKKRFRKIRAGRYILDTLGSSEQVQSLSKDNLPIDMEDGRNLEQEVKLKRDESDFVPAMSLDSNDSSDSYTKELETLHILNVSHWPGITYDVSSQDISIHLPLHRLVSLLLQKALRRCYGESTISITSEPATTSFNFFEHILGGCHPLGFSGFIMEHPLRIRVFVAEVHAGMWKKNGEAALVSCEWYRSVRWSEPGVELDLFMMQCCAALAPPDLYVNRILERFGLSNYLSLNPLPTNEYEPVLVLEMLILIIQIVKERRFCGSTNAESLRRELIYKLAVEDATHSQILKSLPRDLAKLSGIKEILDTVASYSHPKGFNQGMYSLRWPCWRELDLYHPRWNSRDLQTAEERYARFCSVSTLTTQLPRWSNIYAPLSRMMGIATCEATLKIIRAALFYAVFNDKASESRAPDAVLIPALHLLSLALDICFQLRESNDKSYYVGAPVPILELAAEEIDDGLSFGVGKLSLLSLLVMLMKVHKKQNVEKLLYTVCCDMPLLIESLLKKFIELDSGCMAKLRQLAPELVNHELALTPDVDSTGSASDSEKRKAKARQRQADIMAKMRAEQSKFLASVNSTDVDSSSVQDVGYSVAVDEPQDSVRDVCSLCHDSNSNAPLSFLILLQKSRLCSFVDRVLPSWDKVRQPEKHQVPVMKSKEGDRFGSSSSASHAEVTSSAQLLKLFRDAISNFSFEGQPGEVNALLEFITRFPSVRNIQLPGILNDRRESDECRFETLEQDLYRSVQARLNSNPHLLKSIVEDTKDSTVVGVPGECLDADTVLLGKYIACLSRERGESPSASEHVNNNEVLDFEPVSSRDGCGPADCDGVYLSTCGHAVHQGCLDRYLSSLKDRYMRRIVFEGGHIVDLDQGEFVCPVCRRLANSVLPAVPMASSSSLSFPQQPSVFGEDSSSLNLAQALYVIRSVTDLVTSGEIFKAFPLQNDSRLKLGLGSFSSVLSTMYFPRKQERLLVSGRTNSSVIMWDTLQYSLISTEIAARSGRSSFTPNSSLNSLYKEIASSGKFILSLLLKVGQSSRIENTLDVLQRFRGIKLFADSVCSGVSSDYRGGTEIGGNIVRTLKDTEKEGSYVDVQFWRRAADPVLAHDPFSSLMWILYCLPSPFLFCNETFISLVHIFYAISVTQAVITYFGKAGRSGKNGSEINDLESTECLISDIFTMMQESKCAEKHFLSNHIDRSCSITSVVRDLTLPFLRRCALLQKLLTSSSPTPFMDRDHEVDRTSHALYDMMDHSKIDDLNEAHELEKMFKIPSFITVVKDEVLRSLVRRWFHHFSKEVELCRFNSVFCSSPAIPFKLMELPQLYQDLLRKYIKVRCPSCRSVIDDPALCLLCGSLCSAAWKACCSKIGCINHSNDCAAATGVFLLIKRTSILLRRASRQASWPSPYLDAFGEEDIEMQRGKPLYLNEERYAALTYMVASHGIDRSSKVLRQTTLATFLG